MRISVVGNGSIGTLTAILLSQRFQEAQITLIGQPQRMSAASTAAGAMANVYAEMENSDGYIHDVNMRYLEMGKQGSQGWLNYLKSSNGMNVITSPDTYVYLKKGSSEFESLNYGAVCEIAQEDRVLTRLSENDVSNCFPSHASKTINEAIRINGEFTFSTLNLFKHLDNELRKSTVRLVEGLVSEIDLDAKRIKVNLIDDVTEYDLLVVCAGAKTSEILPVESILPIYQGVGVALLLDNIRDIEMDKLRKGVFRSVNRGGAQCGIHLVPREDGKYYLGAGNYVSRIEEPKIRFDTIRYLLDTLSSDLIGKNLRYELTGSIKLGLRPRALDGFPMLGPISAAPSVFIASATNRAGLTWAPYIVEQIAKWVQDKPLDPLIKDWLPDRKPIPFGTVEEGINYFTASRVSNAIEHGLISSSEIESKREEFKIAAENLVYEVNKRVDIDPKFTVNPDNWSAIISSLS